MQSTLHYRVQSKTLSRRDPKAAKIEKSRVDGEEMFMTELRARPTPG
jgi:hypothetical protein